MATKLYYGRCKSLASEAAKEVIISKVEYLVVDGEPIQIEDNFDVFFTQGLVDEDFNPGEVTPEEAQNIHENIDNLASGDLLVVYFQYGNTNESPRILLRNNDSAQEENVSTDTGIYIRTQGGLHINKTGLWGGGETLIFSYVRFVNVGYWYLLNGAVAGKDNYGKVKLTDDYMEGDEDAALTKGAARQLISSVSGNNLEYSPTTTKSVETAGVLRLTGINPQTQESITYSEVEIEVPYQDVFDKVLFELEVEVDSATGKAYAGRDMRLYNNLIAFGWDNCIE